MVNIKRRRAESRRAESRKDSGNVLLSALLEFLSDFFFGIYGEFFMKGG
jgi:hypothetical protein